MSMPAPASGSAWPAASAALGSALLFGASTPLARLLVGEVSPLLLAGLLYLGSGLGLGLMLGVRPARAGSQRVRLPRRDLPWLLAAIVLGGALGPALLMWGLARTDGATASLLLNMEGVMTALIAWGVFKENADRRIVLGMLAIAAGGALLSWSPGGGGVSVGALAILGACLCWALDNNLTRQVSTNDAMLLACLKGLLAGAANTALAWGAGAAWPPAAAVGASLLVGWLGYGLSLTLFVLSLRTLGTARTGAYFSVAPLFGALLSFLLWPQMPSWLFGAAAVLMAFGLWLHLREHHEHEHTHEELEHAHAHRHDEHHRHPHDFAWDGREPHQHPHRHTPLTHRHPHHPDIHHRHRHAR